MRVATEIMTPTEATALIAASTGQRQRNLDLRRVSNYALQMKAGKWRVTHQAIGIDPDGMLIDGQHRVNAVIKAGIPVEMAVARDVDPSTFDAIDNGRSRNPSHALAFAGYGNTAVLAAAIRHYLIYETLAGTTRTTAPDVRALWSTHDIVEFAGEKGGDLILGSLPDATRIGIGVAQAGAKTWLAASLALLRAKGADDELRGEFTERLEQGTMLPNGSPIHALRRWMIAGGYVSQRNDQRSFVGMVMFTKTWNAWLQGDEVRTLTFRPGIERVPEMEPHRTEVPLIELEADLIAAGR